MTRASASSGGDYLAERNDASSTRGRLPRISEVVIVEDETIDADQLRAILNLMFGYGLKVRRANTLGSALDCVIERQPDVVFLDDNLQPPDRADHSIPYLRRAGFTGPIIVVSGEVTRQRGAVLKSIGADYVVHKDELNSTQAAAALTAVFAKKDANGAVGEGR